MSNIRTCAHCGTVRMSYTCNTWFIENLLYKSVQRIPGPRCHRLSHIGRCKIIIIIREARLYMYDRSRWSPALVKTHCVDLLSEDRVLSPGHAVQ